MAKSYLDKTGLLAFWSKIKSLFSTSSSGISVEYGLLCAYMNTACTFDFGSSNNFKLIITTVDGESYNSLSIRQTSATGTLIKTLSSSEISPGVEIEKVSNYLYIRDSSGQLISVSSISSSITKLYFLVDGETSSDNVFMTYRLEVT